MQTLLIIGILCFITIVTILIVTVKKIQDRRIAGNRFSKKKWYHKLICKAFLSDLPD